MWRRHCLVHFNILDKLCLPLSSTIHCFSHSTRTFDETSLKHVLAEKYRKAAHSLALYHTHIPTADARASRFPYATSAQARPLDFDPPSRLTSLGKRRTAAAAFSISGPLREIKELLFPSLSSSPHLLFCARVLQCSFRGAFYSLIEDARL